MGTAKLGTRQIAFFDAGYILLWRIGSSGIYPAGKRISSASIRFPARLFDRTQYDGRPCHRSFWCGQSRQR